jgi:hypothetical protein
MFASLRSDFIHIASESSIHFAGIRNLSSLSQMRTKSERI